MQHPMAPRVGAPRQHVVVRDQPRHGDEEGGVEVGDLVLLISLLLCEVRLFFSRMPPRNRSINTIISTKPTSRKFRKTASVGAAISYALGRTFLRTKDLNLNRRAPHGHKNSTAVTNERSEL